MSEYASYATKEISDVMAAFADWQIAEVFGGKLPEGVDEASFRKGVALGGSLRGYFQKSEAWKSDKRNYLANVEARRVERETARVAAAKAAAVKAAARIKDAEAKLAAATKAAADKAAA
jgi:hypothetical protein